MYFYKLDNKELDAAFLDGSIISGKAVIREEDYVTGKLEEGSHLVVMLSNGKKYKGQIIKFTCKVHYGYAEGELEILRTT